MDRTTYLDQYRVIADVTGAPVTIRRSGNAVTYRAEDLSSGGEVALEVIPVEDFSPEVFERLEKEAAGAKELTHINLPKLRAFGRDADHVVYASEYLDGTSAENWVTQHGPMPVGPALRIGMQVVSTLAEATFHGIVHGAINPRNILLVPGQTAQGDWPLVKILSLVGPAPTFTGSQFAAAEPEFTAQFASPEQLQNGTVDFRSEIYSLGATLCFLLTGAPPANAADRPNVSGLPKPVMQLIEEMLARNPDERPLDPVAFQERIRACLESVERREAIGRKFGVPVAAPVAVSKKREPRSIPWRPLTIAALALLLATLAAVFLADILRPGQVSGSKKDEAIGVPIGVPDASAPPPVQTVANSAVASNPLAPAEAVNQVVAVEPPAPATESEVETQPTLPRPSEPVVAEAAPVKETPAQAAVAKRESAEPTKSPAEIAPPSAADRAPAEEEARRAEPVVAQTNRSAPQPVARRAEATIDGVPVRRAQPVAQQQPAEAGTRVVRTNKRPKRINGMEVRAAEPVEGTPGVPKRSRRARLLGTDDDGSLVFEVPSAEEAFVEPRR